MKTGYFCLLILFLLMCFSNIYDKQIKIHEEEMNKLNHIESRIDSLKEELVLTNNFLYD